MAYKGLRPTPCNKSKQEFPAESIHTQTGTIRDPSRTIKKEPSVYYLELYLYIDGRN